MVPVLIAPFASQTISDGVTCSAPRRFTANRGPRRLSHKRHSWLLRCSRPAVRIKTGFSVSLNVSGTTPSRHDAIDENASPEARLLFDAKQRGQSPQGVTRQGDIRHIQCANERALVV